MCLCITMPHVLSVLGQLMSQRCQDKSWQANHTLCCGMKPLFQIHYPSTLAQYSFPVSSPAISFTLPAVRVAYQVSSSERVLSVPQQSTDSASPEVTSHKFTERQTLQPIHLKKLKLVFLKEKKSSFPRPPQKAKSIMKFKHSHHSNTGLHVKASKACL